jgi:hypothetical protein
MTIYPHPAPAVELTHDRSFEARIRRLSIVSLIALGTITWLAIRDDASLAVVLLLTAGWILMPTLLRASLRRPLLRYGLSIPATLSAGGLTLFCLARPDLGGASVAGWWTITASLWFGALLGMWLWFRWLPVPTWLGDPFGPGRLALVTIHIGGVLIGIALVIV